MALTATATAEVRRDILRQLRFPPSPLVFKDSFFRSNLHLRFCAKPKSAAAEALLIQYLSGVPKDGAVIVYCRARKQCKEMADLLAANGLSAVPYHAGLSAKKRLAAQCSWQSGERPMHRPGVYMSMLLSC
jgi:ATP-dependent DNA helicase RecQ